MSQQTFTITVDVAELLTEFIPTMARQFIALRGPDEALKGTNLTLTVDVSGSRYSYTIKDGQEFDVKQGDIDNPMVLLAIPLETMSLLADMKNIDMLMGFQGQISGGQASRQKLNSLASLKGTAVYKLRRPDGKEAVITATFNGAKTPACTLKLAIEDARTLTARKDTPIQMFMSGKLQIEGEMSFALAMQPLFS
ncbi:MAG: SCP2 sterol-binding domain-containing protein [Thermodesulfobacteriota bacterium]